MKSNAQSDFFLSPWALSEDRVTLIYRPTSEIRSKYEAVFQAAFPKISTQPSTPQGQIITALTEQDTNDLALIGDMANSFFFGGSGQWLDDWAYMLFGLTRKTAIPSTVALDVEGSNGAVISGGFIVSDGSLNYRFDGSYTIPQNGKGQITCICTEVTDKESIAGSVTKIVTPLQGIFRVSNPNNSTPAIKEESDSDFRNRCLKFGTSFKNTSIYAVASEVANVEGVKKINAWDNVSDKQQTFEGTQFDPHSFGIVALGGSDQDIASAIQESKPPCTGMVGTSSVSLPNQNPKYAQNPKYNKNYKFFRPTNVPLKFEVTVSLYTNSPQNYQDIVKNALSWYVDQIEIGGSISLSEASCAILTYANGGFGVKSLKFGKKSGSTGVDQIDLKFVELATIGLSDISVVTG